MSYFVASFLAPSNILSLVLSIRKLIQFKLNKSKHYVSQNLCRSRGINFLLADKNLSENGQTYQFVSQNNFYQFFNCLISSNNSCKTGRLVFSSVIDFIIFDFFPPFFEHETKARSRAIASDRAQQKRGRKPILPSF